MEMDTRKYNAHQGFHPINVQSNVGGHIHRLLGGGADVERDGGIAREISDIEAVDENGCRRFAI
jgi:hypothetical protein